MDEEKLKRDFALVVETTLARQLYPGQDRSYKTPRLPGLHTKACKMVAAFAEKPQCTCLPPIDNQE